MYTLYYAPGAASLVVHWLLLELDIPFDARKVDTSAAEHKSADYLRLNPNGLVPTLLLDGAPMFEAAAMVLHLADAHPAAQLAPAANTVARAHYYQELMCGLRAAISEQRLRVFVADFYRQRQPDDAKTPLHC